MPRKLYVVNSESLALPEPITPEDVEEKTVEDYKKLDEKCDKVISKIKDRKNKKVK